MNKRVLFYVQHLLGIGHIARSSRICQSLLVSGFDVTLAMGGLPIEGLMPTGVRVLQLPPLRANPESFRTLLEPDGSIASDQYKADRTGALMRAFQEIQPDILIIEAFPFDRPQMRFELVPLLREAQSTRPRPLIASSIRDILQRKKDAQRDNQALEDLETFFDIVLIHGDPTFSTLDRTFRHAQSIADMVHYTGIVAPDRELHSVDPDARFDVVVSAGGGAVGGKILSASILAKSLSPLSNARWMAVTGPNLPPETSAALAQSARHNGVHLEKFVPDLANVLAHAELSISQAGYNTIADILRVGCKSVLCPFAEANQTEQALRAELLRVHGRAAIVEEAGLHPEILSGAIREALSLSAGGHSIDLEGGPNTARILSKLIYSP
ncbi:MAG: glycosyltransferase family protein [Hyphomicrobiaceae bacterium]